MATGPVNGQQSGECRDPICSTTVDDLTLMYLSPVANNGFAFKRWDANPAADLFCDWESQNPSGNILVTVSRNGAWIAVFEAVTGTPSTPPGAR